MKDVYAYDSGSNTSSTKSRGPFIQIKGPRDSPLSVNVINSSINDEDGERRLPKSKKFHDDIEYRHKVIFFFSMFKMYSISIHLLDFMTFLQFSERVSFILLMVIVCLVVVQSLFFNNSAVQNTSILTFVHH